MEALGLLCIVLRNGFSGDKDPNSDKDPDSDNITDGKRLSPKTVSGWGRDTRDATDAIDARDTGAWYGWMPTR